jgi:hypothetical protein
LLPHLQGLINLKFTSLMDLQPRAAYLRAGEVVGHKLWVSWTHQEGMSRNRTHGGKYEALEKSLMDSCGFRRALAQESVDHVQGFLDRIDWGWENFLRRPEVMEKPKDGRNQEGELS